VPTGGLNCVCAQLLPAPVAATASSPADANLATHLICRLAHMWFSKK
jgi:hypothetical protein